MNQQSPRIPILISPGLIESLYILGSSFSGTISYGLFHSTVPMSIAYSGGLSGSLYNELSLAGNSESPKRASFSAQMEIIF
jgi:hypothetical protein